MSSSSQKWFGSAGCMDKVRMHFLWFSVSIKHVVFTTNYKIAWGSCRMYVFWMLENLFHHSATSTVWALESVCVCVCLSHADWMDCETFFFSSTKFLLLKWCDPQTKIRCIHCPKAYAHIPVRGKLKIQYIPIFHIFFLHLLWVHLPLRIL